MKIFDNNFNNYYFAFENLIEYKDFFFIFIDYKLFDLNCLLFLFIF